MSTLLLRLASPMQSWGTQSRFVVRDTGLEPSKSGVIGLLCAALGKPREERPDDSLPTLERLAQLRMGVRVDREGSMMVDYHTAGGAHRVGEVYGVIQADGKGRRTVVSNRYYLADADFLVGLEGDDEALLRQLDAALDRPVWPLFLGRKAFVPAVPVRLPDAAPRGPGLRAEPLEEALRGYPWFPDAGRPNERKPDRFRLVVETPDSSGDEVRRDWPICFVSAQRQFRLRYVATTFISREDVPEMEG